MRFFKMQGTGNDYILADCLGEDRVKDPGELSKKISDRHFGVGSDGLILVLPSDKADFTMDMYNSDGSRAQMCGNGIRLLGKLVYDMGYTKKDTISVDTLCGVKYLRLITKDGRCTGSEVDMGKPVLAPKLIPAISDSDIIKDEEITAGGKKYKVTCVSMGNPHCVIFTDPQDPDDIDLPKIGPLFEHHKMFPERTNTEFVKVTDRKHVKMRVWERGAEETLACGTGACAVCVASIVTGRCDREVEVDLRGGKLKIFWDDKTDHVFMTGNAETVCEIILPEEYTKYIK